jgi:hypothetical protein
LTTAYAGSSTSIVNKMNLPGMKSYKNAIRFIYVRPHFMPLAVTLNFDQSPFGSLPPSSAKKSDAEVKKDSACNSNMSQIKRPKETVPATNPYSCDLIRNYGQEGNWLVKDTFLLCNFAVEQMMTLLNKVSPEIVRNDTTAFSQDTSSVWRFECSKNGIYYQIDKIQRNTIILQPMLRNICFELLAAAAFDTIAVR